MVWGDTFFGSLHLLQDGLTQVWRCHLHDHNKVVKKRNTGCVGLTDIKVKNVNIDTKKNGAFLRRDVPLCAVIKLCLHYNHATQCAVALRLLRCSDATKELLHKYFSDGLTPAEAMHLNESTLSEDEDAASASMRAHWQWTKTQEPRPTGQGSCEPNKKDCLPPI